MRLTVLIFFILSLSICRGQISLDGKPKIDESRILSHTVDLNKQHLGFYWKNEKGELYSNFNSLKEQLQRDGQKLTFAMNGGMYNKYSSPQGLFIEKGKILANIDTVKSGYGNFYMQPNGVFYITNDNEAVVCVTDGVGSQENIKYATQSGPMLLIDGMMHPRFIEGSSNLHIRNGVGILPDGKLLFAMSKEKINFYDLASYFKQNGCKNALYLDGFVSRTYLPSKGWEQVDGNFGVIIGETIEKGITD
jgi:uncharacterized protein YigE (DUF2233 family)